MKKIKGFLYDLFGGIIIIIIIFSICFCCSNKFRTLTYTTLDKIENKTDTIHKDTITIIQKDTITKAIPQEHNNIDTIPLFKEKDNLYYINVKINGIPMRFALDTGCSDMSMSIVEYLFLEHQGLIKHDTNQESESILANGEKEQGFITKLDSVTIGNKVIKDVTCSISPKQNAPLLLGQSALSKLGDTTIKYNKGIMLIE